MTHNRYLLFVGIAALVSWVAWYIVISKLDPFASTGLALSLFFLSLFFALSCTLTVFGFYFRLWLNKNEIYSNHIIVAFRQGIELTIISLGCILFLMIGVLNWWSGLLLILCVSLVEFYFVAKQEV
ncbi:hypothetical protein KKD70_04035 [Patescibacteria group bacterium]|nr:hypothetical protein [Patescibacteria group bacterium]